MTTSDHQDFQVPVGIGGWKFASVAELQRHIVWIRDRYKAQAVNKRLSEEHEQLMREVFEHHPNAADKMQGVQYIQVGSNPKSDRRGDVWLVAVGFSK